MNPLLLLNFLKALEEFVKRRPNEDHVKKVIDALNEIQRFGIVREIERTIRDNEKK